METKFGFEDLDCYRLAVQVNRRLRGHKWPRNTAHLRDQALRASDSTVLNLAEGWGRGRQTPAGKNHFRIAHGSIGEVFSVLDILQMDPELKSHCRRVGRMLKALAK